MKTKGMRRKYERKDVFLARIHDAEGKKVYGKERWIEANFGWMTTDTTFASKVYAFNGEPGEVFQTCLNADGKTVTHERRDYMGTSALAKVLAQGIDALSNPT